MATLKATLTKKQNRALTFLRDTVTRFIFFGGGAGGGKSWLGCVWLILLATTCPGIKAFIGRSTLTELMKTTFVTFQKVCRALRLPYNEWKLNGQYNYIEFRNGSRIDLLDLRYLPSDPLYERFGSYEFTVGFIEEAGEIDFAAFDVLKTRIGRHLNDRYGMLGKIFISGNPAKNWTYFTFYKPWKKDELPEAYQFVQALIGDNDLGEEGYRAALRSISDPVLKERLLFGNWDYDTGPGTLVPFDALTDLFTNPVEPGDLYMTVDVARFGSDRTVELPWAGWLADFDRAIIKVGQAITVTAEEVRRLSVEYAVPRSRIIIDEDGVGGGVVDLLEGCKGFVANSPPFPTIEEKEGVKTKTVENFVNLKAQCGFKLAERIRKRAIAIRCADPSLRESIVQELDQTLRQQDPDKEKKLSLVPKDRVKELIGRSPDLADVMLMREAFALLPNEPVITNYHTTQPAGITWEVAEQA